jgi:hypothetical protein
VKFVFFVEGDTEKDVLPVFLKRCLDPHLKQPVGIQTVNFHGWANLWRDLGQKAEFYLRGAGGSPDIVAVVSVLDLYGPDIYPSHLKTSAERTKWAKSEIKKKCNHERFRHFFAVHELEAWLLSQPEIFPPELRKDIQTVSTKPEEVNFDSPPKQRLDRIFQDRLKRGYQPRIDGSKLFRQVNPNIVCDKCPLFQEMINELLNLAKKAGT